jgi:hypothetical protein
MTAQGPMAPMVTFIAANELPHSMAAASMAAVGQNVLLDRGKITYNSPFKDATS